MTAFILIHGAFHGGWCWDRVKPLLTDLGHDVYAPDMPSNGEDPTPPEDVTLADYVEKVGEVLTQVDEQAVLVGHSLGGATITQAGEIFANKIIGLVYLAAAIPSNGQCRADLTMSNENSLLNKYRRVTADEKSVYIVDEGIVPTFYEDCDDATIMWAKTKLVRQSMAIFTTPVSTSQQKWGKLPRGYIVCQQDRAILPDSQEYMCQMHRCNPVITMDTSHSPFLSAPSELAGHLDKISILWR
jgi:pimeloyl-ACP methyl ester carboxylesterase